MEMITTVADLHGHHHHSLLLLDSYFASSSDNEHNDNMVVSPDPNYYRSTNRMSVFIPQLEHDQTPGVSSPLSEGGPREPIIQQPAASPPAPEAKKPRRRRNGNTVPFKQRRPLSQPKESESPKEKAENGKKQKKCSELGEKSDKKKRKKKKTSSCDESLKLKTSSTTITTGGTERETETETGTDYIHVRARRGQATDPHSLAERVRREKISERMKRLQGLVPGCDKVAGKALVLDEIINYIQSLQVQVEFLSMKLASISPLLYDSGRDLDHFTFCPHPDEAGGVAGAEMVRMDMITASMAPHHPNVVEMPTSSDSLLNNMTIMNNIGSATLPGFLSMYNPGGPQSSLSSIIL